jgi:hypothetical protein
LLSAARLRLIRMSMVGAHGGRSHDEWFKECLDPRDPLGAAVTTPRPDSLAYPPRGMSRDEAARYVGVGATKFDEMVADRRMPRPKRVDGRVIWDRFKLEAAFTDLPEEKRINPFDCILSNEA